MKKQFLTTAVLGLIMFLGTTTKANAQFKGMAKKAVKSQVSKSSTLNKASKAVKKGEATLDKADDLAKKGKATLRKADNVTRQGKATLRKAKNLGKSVKNLKSNKPSKLSKKVKF